MIIVIEGGDQAGKKTQSELLAKALKARKLKTKVFIVSGTDFTRNNHQRFILLVNSRFIEIGGKTRILAEKSKIQIIIASKL